MTAVDGMCECKWVCVWKLSVKNIWGDTGGGVDGAVSELLNNSNPADIGFICVDIAQSESKVGVDWVEDKAKF